MATNETKALTSAPSNDLAKADPVKAALFNEENLRQMALALPKHLTADRLARLALTEFRKNTALHKCSAQSIVAAAMQAAQLGLEFGGVLGQCYMVPYKQEAQLIIGYRGLVELARRSGQIINVLATAVYENDEFEWEEGLQPKIVHKPTKGTRGQLTHVYAIAWFKSGLTQFVVMTREEVERIRNGSNGYKVVKKFGSDSPWDTHFEEMAKKTAIRRLSKQLPLSPEIRAVIDRDESRENEVEPIIDVPFEVDDGEGRQIDATTGEVLADDAIDVTAETVTEPAEEPAQATQATLPLDGEF